MYQPAKSGKPPVVAGDADDSEMMRRILLPEGHEDKMPKDGPPLTEEDVEVLTKWIDQGANGETTGLITASSAQMYPRLVVFGRESA